ncbi:DUF4153 domain-containing protein [Neobacillus niacini]|uniref:DUF4153 domain-containing protein n=1 Tax=Neobacillus niacini TaxID=86668 RepID=UPI0021CAEEB5|nr:DUF4173 domain-containing protein [Neobacillus niacini]MCM3764241.1 DUF4173 domain-containing protein [Neobacillus niacini]
MEKTFATKDWVFLFLCLLLGILAEEMLLRGKIGISYLVFISAFYGVFFWRFRGFSFSHQRFGYLLLCCIWLLAAGYFINDNILFQVLNMLVIPVLAIAHLAVVTSPKNQNWNQFAFIHYLFNKLIGVFKYVGESAGVIGKGVKRGVDEDKLLIWKKVLIGVLISIPILAVVLRLLMSADTQFERMIGGIPNWFLVIDMENFIRLLVVLFLTAAFFSYMQVLLKKHIQVLKQQDHAEGFKIDAIITVTFLVLINLVYVLFTVVQFKYFFSGTLQSDFTYAEYARKGFFELLFVTMFNLSVTVIVLTFVDRSLNGLKMITQVLLTLLVGSSFVMLSSAFMRLSIYEEAYGFTFTRVLVHSFMLFLVFILVYTLAKIWMEKLSLFHFYFIASLIYYTAIAVIDLDRFVVKKNIERYEDTGKIDVHYLNSLSYMGVQGLIELYEKHPEIEGLGPIIQDRKQEAVSTDNPWQSFNLARELTYKELRNLDLK